MEENKNKPEDIDIDEEEIESEEAEAKSSKPDTVKKTFWDYNLSWVLIIALAVAAILIAQANVREVITYINNSVLYILLQVLLSLIIGTVFYSLGRIIGGYLCGYRLLYIQVFGLKFAFPNKKFKFSAPKGLWGLADFRLVMTPKESVKNPNPSWMFFGGLIVSVLLQGLMVGIGFALKGQGKMGDLFHLSTLFALGYVGMVILYQWIPVRIDCFNDGFLFIKTRKAEDRLAYNLYLTNLDRDEAHLPLIIEKFDNYASYTKANYLYYVYLSELYEDHLEQAVSALNTATYLTPYLTFENSVKIKGEKLFVLLIADEVEKADKTFRSYSHDERSEIEKNRRLSDFRTALLTAGMIETEYNRTKQIAAEFEKLIGTIAKNPRVEKEVYLFDLALAKIKMLHPEWDFENLTVEESAVTVDEDEPEDEDEED